MSGNVEHQRIVNVVVNGRSVDTTAANLSELVAVENGNGVRIATALNGRFIREAERATTVLNPGDRIEIVSPRQGG